MRRKVFVSYHHGGDQRYYDAFSRAFHNDLQVITDNSLERRIDSNNSEYVMRRIRENYLRGSSCTIVLCGADTWQRKYVDWEIKASLDQGMGLIGVWLPTLPRSGNGTNKPDRLQDNIDSGYAIWTAWADISASHQTLTGLIEGGIAKPFAKAVNTQPLRMRNG